MIRQHQPEPLTDHETDVDPQEAEDEMNNLPSPRQKSSPFWNPQYQARREARRRLWSPPITPPLPGIRYYSLQPSQRAPSATPRPSSPARNLRPPDFPHLPPDFPLQLPPKPRHNAICKSRPHRPITRSMKASSLMSLHLRKGWVEITAPAGQSSSATFKQCMDDGVSSTQQTLSDVYPKWLRATRDSSKIPVDSKVPRVGCTIAIDQHPSPSQQHPSSTTILPTKSWALLERVRTITMAQEHAGSSGWGVAQRICCRERLQVFLIPELVHGTHGGGQNIPATGQG
ncbi:hypothetical protein XPA_010712 [Xanthoria parietina]